MRKFIAARKRQLIAFVVAILVIVGIIGGLWITNVFGWRQWRVQEAQGFIGASLPQSAADVRFTTRNQYTRIVWLRFSLPPNADLIPFLTQMGITDALKTGFTPFPAANPQEAAITWWQPIASKVFSGVYWNTGAKVIEILLDKTDGSQPVVYLRAYALGKT
ncbi:MAG: hypothetical protein H0X30_21660 [Anaerolineae bacterium]|nr:hypothetical protein [Anaerolineae bacterium]